MLYLCKLKSENLKEEYMTLQFLLKKEASYFYSQIRFISNILDDLNFNLNTALLLDRFVLESRC